MATLVYETFKKLIATILQKHPYIQLFDLYIYVQPNNLQQHLTPKLTALFSPKFQHIYMVESKKLIYRHHFNILNISMIIA